MRGDSHIPNNMKTYLSKLTLCAILIVGSAHCAIAQNDDPYTRLKSYFYGRDASAIDEITTLVASARLNPSQKPGVASGLASVLTSDAVFDAKQFACRQLAFIAGPDQVPALAGLLADDKLSHYALMALSRIPGNTALDAVAAHIADAPGRNKLEVLALLADHNDPRAVPALMEMLKGTTTGSSDEETIVSALAKIADPPSISALKNAWQDQSGSVKKIAGFGLIQAGYQLRARGKSTIANALFTLVDTDAADPSLRGAALRGRVLTSTAPASLIIKALSGSGLRQSMAADIVREAPGADTTRTLSIALPTLSTKGQTLLLTALGDRGDHAASAGVMKLTRSADASVRIAALKALGQVGDPSAVGMLLNAATNRSGAEKEAARESLGRVRGEGIDAALAATISISDAKPELVAEAISALGRRKAVEAVPALLKSASSHNTAISAASITVLRDIAPASQTPALIALLLATPVDNRDTVAEALAETARRGTSETARTGSILQALHLAKKPEDRLSLLAALNQVGGPLALKALEQALSDPAASVQDGALAIAAEWPTDEPLELLLKTMRSTNQPRRKAIALRGSLRMIGANDQRSPEQTLTMVKELLSLSNRPEEQRQALSSIGKLKTASALTFASGFLKNDSVKGEAETAVIEIAHSTIGAYPEETKSALDSIVQSGSSDEAKKRAADVLALPAKAAGFVLAWEVSPSYHRDNVDYKTLFDMPFPPEIAGQEKQTPWRLMPVLTSADQPYLLDLVALWGGEQRVAYLRTAIKAESEKDVTLELGSDDGVKAWLNGAVVISDNTARAVAPGQEKAQVHLKAGWNTLLLKVTQNNQGWGACCRILGPDGNPATDLQYSVAPAAH